MGRVGRARWGRTAGLGGGRACAGARGGREVGSSLLVPSWTLAVSGGGGWWWCGWGRGRQGSRGRGRGEGVGWMLNAPSSGGCRQEAPDDDVTQWGAAWRWGGAGVGVCQVHGSWHRLLGAATKYKGVGEGWKIVSLRTTCTNRLRHVVSLCLNPGVVTWGGGPYPHVRPNGVAMRGPELRHTAQPTSLRWRGWWGGKLVRNIFKIPKAHVSDATPRPTPRPRPLTRASHTRRSCCQAVKPQRADVHESAARRVVSHAMMRV